MKKLLSVFVFIIMLFALTLCAGAMGSYDDIFYEGVLGSYYETEPGDSGSVGDRITITENVSYDSSEKLFYYSTRLGYVTSNIFDGMLTTDKVKIDIPAEAESIEILCNGEKFTGEATDITFPGNYLVRYTDSDGTVKTLLSFTICSKLTTEITYTLPDGFSADTLTRNGDAVTVPGGYISFDNDGKYSLTYRCNETNVKYNLEITIDSEPPELELIGLSDGNRAWGPVELKGVEEDGRVVVLRDGKQEDYSPTFTKSGHYEIAVYDKAGNKSTCSFTIMIYLNSGSIIFFAVLAAVIVGVAAYIIISRKKLRIR